MRQVQIEAFGPPEVLHLVEAAEPAPGPEDIVIRVGAAGITFVETQVRGGRPPWPGPLPDLPMVPGNGVEGAVVAVGAKADQAWLGRRVVAATGGRGGYAELVAVPASEAIPIPAGLEPGVAVALLADGRTALALSRAAAITGADRVLVTAAGGGVGSLLVQLARLAGARQVIAAAGSARKLALARDLGASAIVNYEQPGWDEAVVTIAGQLDVVFDGVGGNIGGALLDLVAAGGRFLAYGGASGRMTETGPAGERGVTIIPGYSLVRSPEDNRQLVEQALAMAAAGQIRPVIGQRYSLEQAAEAHTAMEARSTLGKTVLIPGKPG